EAPCRVAAEERRVVAPGLGGSFGERAAHRKEKLRRLAEHLIDTVDCERGNRGDHADREELHEAWRTANEPPDTPARPGARPHPTDAAQEPEPSGPADSHALAAGPPSRTRPGVGLRRAG